MKKNGTKEIKLVIWDADNTLWNGSVYYVDKDAVSIKPGTRAALKELNKRGIINSLCSKNNYADADLMLKKFEIDKYFREPQIGWGLKSEAVKKLAEIFNVSFGEILFIDDDPFQRAEVLSRISGINVAELADPIDILNIEGIKLLNETEEDKKRVQILKEDRYRELAEKDHCGDYHDFLRQCNIKMIIREVCEEDWPRVVQLLNRTNELNATGNRYELDELMNSYQLNKDIVLVVELEDKFGDYGLIAETIIDTQDSDIWFIKDLTVSCRTMGRGIGGVLVLTILNLAKNCGINKVRGYIKPSESNWRMRPLYEKRGFKKVFDDGKITKYEFDLNNEIFQYPDWIEVAINVKR